jgi:hypothetical protein
LSIGTATLEDKRVLARINLPAEERFETPVGMRAMLLVRVWRWADRVGASECEVARVVDSLGLTSVEVIERATEYSHRFV